MNEATIRKLEFDEIRRTIAEYCASRLGKALALSVEPAVRIEQVREWLNQVREMTEAAERVSLPPMGGVYDVREAVRSAIGSPIPLEAEALAQIAETLAATEHLRTWFARIGPEAPTLQRLGQRIPDLRALAEAIHACVHPRGEVLDHASARLATIRRSLEGARAKIRQVFDRLLRQAGVTRMLQYTGATFHDDRMVLPLKADYRGRIPGIIHRSSESGATIFVEPSESVEMNNTIIRLKEEESKEITRILQELTRLVRADGRTILDALRAIAVLDLIAGKCRYAKKRSCVCPTITDDAVMDLHDARHPLLIELFDREVQNGSPPRAVVPIDVRLGDDFDVLVITGPNTGGKTVALKTVGLFALMTQAGIPIPVGPGSRMPVYKDVWIDVGDEQSLQQSLSTFSSHLSNLLEVLRRCGSRSLVLIDELGAGTDPDEGAAIGRAILSELLDRRAKALVTTHIGALKAVAYQTDRVDNAAVEFDPQTLQPTYRLRLGEPGNSNALIIAERLGMPDKLIRRARGFLADRDQSLRRAIAGTLKSRREAEAARKAAREAALAADRQREAFEREQERLRREQEAFARWTTWVNTLRAGDEVYVRPLKRPGKIVRMQLHKQSVLVSAGAMDLELPLREIDAVAGLERSTRNAEA